METVRPNIAFAGLTAAGKTTHAKLLAFELGYEYVSATEIILEILDMTDDPDKAWFRHYDEIEEAREGDQIDIELERRIKEIADDRDGLVLDTWAMAYIYKGPLIRIWLESDEPSRMRKCFVSQGEDVTLNLEGCHDLLSQKDRETRLKFLRRLKFDLFDDMSRYDAIVCNTELIPVPTREASDEGIRKFAPVVYDVAEYMVERAINNPESFTKTREEIFDSHGTMVQKIDEYPWSFRNE